MSEDRPRAVITGMGVVTPLGRRVSDFWQGLVAGRSAVEGIQRFDVSAYPTRIAAAACSQGTDDERIRRFATEAADQAVADSGLDQGRASESLQSLVLAAGPGMSVGEGFFSSCAALKAGQDFEWAEFHNRYRDSLGSRGVRTPGGLCAEIARRFGISGDLKTVMTACSAGTQALGDACRLIRLGLSQSVLIVAADSEIYPMGLASFCLLKALSTRNSDPQEASRPFDGGRDGFVLGEGSAALVVEEAQRAKARGARFYAEVAGFGSACDAYRVTDPHPAGRGAIAAMRRALDEGRVNPHSVGYINAHGTSTPRNDRVETAAIKRVFGSEAGGVAISSIKSMIGHLTVAAGGVEAVATAMALKTGVLPPTINHDEPDPDCDLDYVPNEARAASVEYALSNSFAFGGQCASLLLRRCS